ncbi:MAG: hypothetical protein JXA90_16930, partial [Planctomycetes bacterium]|nr:hypothetical protein [Planctomycetota bacterium]
MARYPAGIGRRGSQVAQRDTVGSGEISVASHLPCSPDRPLPAEVSMKTPWKSQLFLTARAALGASALAVIACLIPAGSPLCAQDPP